MGRRKKSKWWHQQATTQAAPDQPKPTTGRWLIKGDVIQFDDQFLSAGQFYPVSSTVGFGWTEKLPPMWRGPLPGKEPAPAEQVVVSTKHQEFLDLVEMAGFILPRQFQDWRRFFLDEKNFLAEAEHWLSMRLQGRFPKIEDDVDKGLMTKTGAAPSPSPRPYQPYYTEDDDYWTSWAGWGGAKTNRWSHYAEPSLPLTPKIPAPSGTCARELVVL